MRRHSSGRSPASANLLSAFVVSRLPPGRSSRKILLGIPPRPVARGKLTRSPGAEVGVEWVSSAATQRHSPGTARLHTLISAPGPRAMPGAPCQPGICHRFVPGNGCPSLGGSRSSCSLTIPMSRTNTASSRGYSNTLDVCPAWVWSIPTSLCPYFWSSIFSGLVARLHRSAILFRSAGVLMYGARRKRGISGCRAECEGA